MDIFIKLARRNFKDYSKKMGGVSVNGTPIPKWEDLGDAVREGWIAGTKGVIDEYEEMLTLVPILEKKDSGY